MGCTPKLPKTLLFVRGAAVRILVLENVCSSLRDSHRAEFLFVCLSPSITSSGASLRSK